MDDAEDRAIDKAWEQAEDGAQKREDEYLRAEIDARRKEAAADEGHA